jgi:hypothetical protein
VLAAPARRNPRAVPPSASGASRAGSAAYDSKINHMIENDVLVSVPTAHGHTVVPPGDVPDDNVSADRRTGAATGDRVRHHPYCRIEILHPKTSYVDDRRTE